MLDKARQPRQHSEQSQKAELGTNPLNWGDQEAQNSLCMVDTTNS